MYTPRPKNSMLQISQAKTPEQTLDIQAMLREYTEWALTLTEGQDVPTFENLEQELASLPGPFAPPAGCLLIAKDDGEPAGCIALRDRGEGTSELKRLYVQPGHRGKDLGRILVGAVIECARELGYRRIILDSHVSMTKAHEIYANAGFRVIPPPDDFPAALRDLAIFMQLDL
jgi:GNAT superfamily N-acetyltransferase